MGKHPHSKMHIEKMETLDLFIDATTSPELQFLNFLIGKHSFLIYAAYR